MRSTHVERQLERQRQRIERERQRADGTAELGDRRHAEVDVSLAGVALRLSGLEASVLAVLARLDYLERAVSSHATDKKAHK